MKLNRNFLLITGIAVLLITCLIIWRPWPGSVAINDESDPGKGATLSSSRNLESVSSIAGLNDWKELDDPVQDGWESEALHDLLKKKLAVISGQVTSDVFDQDLLSKVVGQNVEGSVLVPVISEDTWSGGGVVVRRREVPEEVSYSDRAGFTSALQMIARLRQQRREPKRAWAAS